MRQTSPTPSPRRRSKRNLRSYILHPPGLIYIEYIRARQTRFRSTVPFLHVAVAEADALPPNGMVYLRYPGAPPHEEMQSCLRQKKKKNCPTCPLTVVLMCLSTVVWCGVAFAAGIHTYIYSHRKTPSYILLGANAVGIELGQHLCTISAGSGQRGGGFKIDAECIPMLSSSNLFCYYT